MQQHSNGRVRRSPRSRMAHAGELDGTNNRPMSEPIYQNSVYAFTDASQADLAFAAGQPLYARDGMPNVRALERTVADLEHAEDAIAVSSGMAAISMVFLSLLKSGSHVVVGCEGYCDTAALLAEMRAKFGIRFTSVNLSDESALREAITPETQVIFAETISNPGLRLANLPVISAVSNDHRITLVVDNTFATPALCRPIDFGADVVIHSAGKFLGGHSDVTAGVVAGSQDLIAEIKRVAYLYGPLLAPMEAWLTMRGIKTLGPRMQWSSRSAGKVADWLAVQPAVESVRYAGHPEVDLTARLLPDGGGGVLAFTMSDGEAAASSLLSRLKTIPYVPSVGGTATIASFPPRSPSFDVDGRQIVEPYRSDTIRLSIGLEDPDEIIADLNQAIVAVTGARSLA